MIPAAALVLAALLLFVLGYALRANGERRRHERRRKGYVSNWGAER